MMRLHGGPTATDCARRAGGRTWREANRAGLAPYRWRRTYAADDPGRLSAGPELHPARQLLAPSRVAQRFHVERVLPAHRPDPGGGQVRPGNLRRPAGTDGH